MLEGGIKLRLNVPQLIAQEILGQPGLASSVVLSWFHGQKRTNPTNSPHVGVGEVGLVQVVLFRKFPVVLCNIGHEGLRGPEHNQAGASLSLIHI